MHIEDVYHQLTAGAGPGACWDAARRYLENLGFDRIIYISLKDGIDRPHVRTTMPDQFQAHYVENGFALDDPFLHYCLPSHDTIATGKAYLDQYDYLTLRQKDLITAAGDVGFNAGFSVTTRVPSRLGAEGWNIGSSLTCRAVEAAKNAHFAQIRPLLFALSGQLAPHAQQPPLSNREQECLDLLSEGLRIKAIAQQMGIQTVTVDMHLSNARKKMNAPTTKNLLKKYWEMQVGRATPK